MSCSAYVTRQFITVIMVPLLSLTYTYLINLQKLQMKLKFLTSIHLHVCVHSVLWFNAIFTVCSAVLGRSFYIWWLPVNIDQSISSIYRLTIRLVYMLLSDNYGDQYVITGYITKLSFTFLIKLILKGLPKFCSSIVLISSPTHFAYLRYYFYLVLALNHSLF